MATFAKQYGNKQNEPVLQEALAKVLGILGEQSKERTLDYIKRKYGFELYNNIRPFTVQEIEGSIIELFGNGGQLIIEIMRAEIQRRS